MHIDFYKNTSYLLDFRYNTYTYKIITKYYIYFLIILFKEHIKKTTKILIILVVF
jgi:hypothetical protein